MEIHRNNSPKTVIILILISVLSFAFVACNNPGLECIKSDGRDIEDCEKGCFDDNGKYREDTCSKLCDRYRYDGSLYYGSLDNDKKDLYLRACSISCSFPNCYDYGDCLPACFKNGDTAACEKYKKEDPDGYDSFACIYGDAAACENAKSAETYDKNPFEAVIACDVEAMKPLLAKNPALVSARYKDYSQYKSNENTLLHFAVYCRNEMTKTLIDAGADVNAKSNNGFTPLMDAVSTCDMMKGKICPNPETTKILIDAGADVNAQGILNVTPLTMAIHRSTNIACVKLLIAAGANVKEHFERKKSPLYMAVEVENPGLVRLLISSGAYYDEKALDYIRKKIYNKRNKGETPSSDMLLIRDILEDAQRR